MVNIDNLSENQKNYILDIIEYHNSLNYKSFKELKFNSIKTKNIELIIGLDEFITLSLLTKKEDLKEFNIISIYEPNEPILENSFYDSFNNHIILKFSDIRKDINLLYNNKKINKDEYEQLKNEEINENQFLQLIDFIKENKNNKFIINCHAGISRSAAIGFILEDILNNNQIEKEIEQNKILSHWRYSPNKIIIEKYTQKEFNNIYDNDLDLDNIF